MSNMDLRTKRLLMWSKNEKAPPFQLTVGVTDYCNLTCRFCMNWLSRDRKNIPQKKELDQDTLIRIIKECGKLGVKVVNVSGGGEPFFNKSKMLSVMEEIKKHNMDGSTTSNGTLIDDDAADRIVKIGWNRINFSIDGSCAETHDYLRYKPGSFDRTMNTILSINKYKKKYASLFPKLGINFVVVDLNYLEIKSLLSLAQNNNIETITFIPVTVHHHEGKQLKLKQENHAKFSKIIQESIVYAEKMKLTTNLLDLCDTSLVEKSNKMDEFLIQKPKKTKITNNFLNIPCYEPWLSLVVHSDGYYDPCEMNTKLADIREASIEELWYNGDHFNRVRDQFAQNKIPETCSKCCEPLVMRNHNLRNKLRKMMENEN